MIFWSYLSVWLLIYMKIIHLIRYSLFHLSGSFRRMVNDVLFCANLFVSDLYLRWDISIRQYCNWSERWSLKCWCFSAFAFNAIMMTVSFVPEYCVIIDKVLFPSYGIILFVCSNTTDLHP